MTARDQARPATKSKAKAKKAAPTFVGAHTFTSAKEKPKAAKPKPGSTRLITRDEYRGNPEAIGQAVMGNHLNKLPWSKITEGDDGYVVEGWAEKG